MLLEWVWRRLASDFVMLAPQMMQMAPVIVICRAFFGPRENKFEGMRARCPKGVMETLSNVEVYRGRGCVMSIR